MARSLHSLDALESSLGIVDGLEASLVKLWVMLRYLVLGLLRDGQPLHGYALMKAYRERSGSTIGTGAFYRELARLVSEGLVESVARDPEADPRRAPYRLTSRGMAAFDAWLSRPHPSTMGRHDDELSMAVLFLPLAGSDAVDRLCQALQEDLWVRSKALERARANARSPSEGTRQFEALDLLLGRRLKHVAAELEFLGELRAAYDGWRTRHQAGRSTRPSTEERSRHTERRGARKLRREHR